MERVSSDDADATEAVDGVSLAALVGGERMTVQHFEIEPGARVPEHDHPHEQTGFLYEGELVFHGDDEATVVSAGDSYTIPGGEAHAVENRGEEVARGVDVFSPPRDDPAWRE